MPCKTECKKQKSARFTDRPSPPMTASSCPGMTKKGGDGTMYVSSQNASGSFRWKKKSSIAKNAKTCTKKKSCAPKPCGAGRERNPETGRCKKVACKKTKTVTKCKDGKCPPKKTTKMTVRIENSPDSEMVTFKPVHKRPSGENWIFYDLEVEEFRRPTFYTDEEGFVGGNEYMDKFEILNYVENGEKVWAVNGIPKLFEQ